MRTARSLQCDQHVIVRDLNDGSIVDSAGIACIDIFNVAARVGRLWYGFDPAIGGYRNNRYVLCEA